MFKRLLFRLAGEPIRDDLVGLSSAVLGLLNLYQSAEAQRYWEAERFRHVYALEYPERKGTRETTPLPERPESINAQLGVYVRLAERYLPGTPTPSVTQASAPVSHGA